MRRVILGSLGATLLLLPVVTACSGAPVIEVSESTYDFGVVVEGDDITRDFVIRNIGDETLEIVSVRTSCGCTTTALSGTEIASGSATRLGVRLSTAGSGGMEIERRIYIESTDPENPEIILYLIGTIVGKQVYLLNPQDLAGSLVLLIDVREPEIYALGHLLGAVNLRASEAEAWMDKLPRSVRIVLYDEDGTTSAQLADAMLTLGYTNLQALLGGYSEWTRLYGDRMIVAIPFLLGL